MGRLLGGLWSWLAGAKQPPLLDVAARFDLDRTAISGTMSTFHRARDRNSVQIVGLKLCDAEKTAAFERTFAGLNKPSEGEISTSLNHPRIVHTIEHGQTTDGRAYLVQEFLDGVGLHTLIASGSPILVERRGELIRWAVEAVAAVHEAGWIHHDICPRNFIVGHSGEWLKLIDFGLTVPARQPFTAHPNRTGVPRYMAPEVFRMRTIDQRADLFSLGVTLYEVCAGAHPWPGGETSGQAAVDHDTIAPRDIRSHSRPIDEPLAAAIMSCLSVEANERPVSARELLRSL